MPAAVPHSASAASPDARRSSGNPWRVELRELGVQELYAYEGSTTEATSEEDEVRLVENDRIDLEPMIRDLVVLALPLSPVCSDDCQGLCVDCGQRLDELPADHSHDVLDPRFAALADR